ncbi:hypothetical protein CYMTET_9800 [Cymbomonas tetramitiformis]|uniref:Uncharacterized protein n=1 Tax=Cymbomonas tetramitiformis TaxID=36881 RepID=A0AAE0GQG6_9CHLO|nr:hypothetical protein CYMTET_9800 [Cymbomonas tetramitiformis]|eukprot:gene23048-27893_t
MQDLATLKVPELKAELSNRGLETKGVKAELLQRLQEAMQSEQTSAATSDPMQPNLLSEQNSAPVDPQVSEEANTEGTDPMPPSVTVDETVEVPSTAQDSDMVNTLGDVSGHESVALAEDGSEVQPETATETKPAVLVDSVEGDAAATTSVTSLNQTEADPVSGQEIQVETGEKRRRSSVPQEAAPAEKKGRGSGNAAADQQDPERTIFVGGLPDLASAESLTEFFCSYGEVIYSKVICNQGTSTCKGFGFVTFQHPDIAQRLRLAKKLQDLATLEFFGKKLDIGEPAYAKNTHNHNHHHRGGGHFWS